MQRHRSLTLTPTLQTPKTPQITHTDPSATNPDITDAPLMTDADTSSANARKNAAPQITHTDTSCKRWYNYDVTSQVEVANTNTQLWPNTASPPNPQSETGTLATHSGKTRSHISVASVNYLTWRPSTLTSLWLFDSLTLWHWLQKTSENLKNRLKSGALSLDKPFDRVFISIPVWSAKSISRQDSDVRPRFRISERSFLNSCSSVQTGGFWSNLAPWHNHYWKMFDVFIRCKISTVYVPQQPGWWTLEIQKELAQQLTTCKKKVKHQKVLGPRIAIHMKLALLLQEPGLDKIRTIRSLMNWKNWTMRLDQFMQYIILSYIMYLKNEHWNLNCHHFQN